MTTFSGNMTTEGEQFLLPSQVQTRERSQLDVRLNGEESLLLDNRQYEWYNSKVKFIQKKAVANLLRGKIRNMPYVIFGPPGTGKTAKLVEMIIQIFKLIPTARMLVGTPSNNSADVITTQLIGVLRMYELIRLVSHKELKKRLIPEHLMPNTSIVLWYDNGTQNPPAVNLSDHIVAFGCDQRMVLRMFQR
uniref:DNA2/NAM7 helicase helicase domain-containing protein n=1 Tax=Glossina palpalis gambiensis TaxID=67801 RepID=A0A1B0BGZ6_9MUSC